MNLFTPMKHVWLPQIAVLVLCSIPALSAAAPAAPRCLTECSPRIGIVSAFGAEADILIAETQRKRVYRINGNRYTVGVLRGNPVVIALSGWIRLRSRKYNGFQ